MARRKLPVLLTLAETESLLVTAREAADSARTPTKQLASWRDFVMVQVGVLAGLRVAELCDLRVPDIDLAGAVLAVLEGKGRKDRNIPIGAKLLRVLREWIGDRTDGYLFPGPRGKRLCTRTFQVRLEKLATAAGIRKNIHPHQMRHTFACALLRTGADLTDVQELLGHENLATTAIYLHCDTTKLRKVVDRL